MRLKHDFKHVDETVKVHSWGLLMPFKGCVKNIVIL